MKVSRRDCGKSGKNVMIYLMRWLREGLTSSLVLSTKLEYAKTPTLAALFTTRSGKVDKVLKRDQIQ